MFRLKNHGSFFITGERYLIDELSKFNIGLSLDIGAHQGLYSKLRKNTLML